MADHPRAPRNRTLTLSAAERRALKRHVVPAEDLSAGQVDCTVLGDFHDAAPRIAPGSVDLLILDPPYNMSKSFGGVRFAKRSVDAYTDWLGEVLDTLLPLLAGTATVYICGDWQSSPSIFAAASARLRVRNRITWEREKGRGARSNWKNASEDIWFCTVGNDFTFHADAVKQRRPVIAPYRDPRGAPKDWVENGAGGYRDTAPSNIWTDITVPFWSMPENTDHPAQKSEKLVAKLILASSDPGALVLDPFVGSGTTSVVAKKLDRRYLGIEMDPDHALMAEKRLRLTDDDPAIQGYADGVFHPRNRFNRRT